MQAPRYVESNLETRYLRLHNRKMHEEKLNNIYENRNPQKFNPVPHKEEAIKIFKELKEKRDRNIKQHE